MVGGRLLRWGAAGVITAAVTVQLPASAAEEGARAVVPPEVVTVDAKTLQRMVEEELSRQLPGAVEREWEQQLTTVARERGKGEEAERRAAVQHVAMRREAVQQSLDELREKQGGAVNGVDGKAGGR